MSDKLQIAAISANDRDWVFRTAQFVFGKYPGGLDRWDFPDNEKIWKIHFGKRAAVVGVNLEGRCCCVKLFYDNRFHIRLRNLLGFSKARRAFLKAVELKRRGILCPDALGWAVDKKTALTLLVSELIRDGERADKYIETNGGFEEDKIKSLARFIRNMHDAGVAHKDLSLRNIMAGLRDGNLCFWLLDCEDAEFSSAINDKKRLSNLYHLYERALAISTHEQRILFLKNYLNDKNIDEWANQLKKYLEKHPSKYSKQAS